MGKDFNSILQSKEKELEDLKKDFDQLQEEFEQKMTDNEQEIQQLRDQNMNLIDQIEEGVPSEEGADLLKQTNYELQERIQDLERQLTNMDKILQREELHQFHLSQEEKKKLNDEISQLN